MYKSILFSLVVITNLFSAIKPNNKQGKPVITAPEEQSLPKVIDKTWFFCGAANDAAFYADMSSVEAISSLGASSIWVKQFDFKNGKIRLIKYAYRNDGTEYVGIAMAIYSKDMVFLDSYLTPFDKLEWQAVVPGTIAERVRDEVRAFFKWLKERDNTPSKPSDTMKS